VQEVDLDAAKEIVARHKAQLAKTRPTAIKGAQSSMGLEESRADLARRDAEMAAQEKLEGVAAEVAADPSLKITEAAEVPNAPGAKTPTVNPKLKK